jgi:hypothetical protein
MVKHRGKFGVDCCDGGCEMRGEVEMQRGGHGPCADVEGTRQQQ